MGLNNFILTCEKDNEELRKDLEYYKNMTSRLKKENQKLKEKYLNTVSDYETTMSEKNELKKQLENCYCNRTDCSGRIKDSKVYDSLVQKVENQQQEFIKWLEAMLDNENDIFSVVRVKDVLQKYKSIIGDDK